MQLSKRIPSRKKTITFLWLKKDFMIMSLNYRHVRAKLHSPMDTCYWCGHAFIDGEMMALGALPGAGNKVFFQKCAKEACE